VIQPKDFIQTASLTSDLELSLMLTTQPNPGYQILPTVVMVAIPPTKVYLPFNQDGSNTFDVLIHDITDRGPSAFIYSCDLEFTGHYF
jgi:hypothetical protein